MTAESPDQTTEDDPVLIKHKNYFSDLWPLAAIYGKNWKGRYCGLDEVDSATRAIGVIYHPLFPYTMKKPVLTGRINETRVLFSTEFFPKA